MQEEVDDSEGLDEDNEDGSEYEDEEEEEEEEQEQNDDGDIIMVGQTSNKVNCESKRQTNIYNL